MSSEESKSPLPGNPGHSTPVRVLHLVLVLVFAGLAVYHQVQFWHWYIEDAAISFAFARNWAWGEGLVAYPGGERLEGYSNFTWVTLLAIAQLLGWDGFQSSKVMQAVLAFFTVPLVYGIAREAAPDERSHIPVIAAGYLATASTYAIWGACGLENSLFSFLLAAGLYRTAIEVRTAAFPWAALIWFLLGITRPEAILYCAIAGSLYAVFMLLRPPEHASDNRWKLPIKRTLQWLALFFVPFGLYHAIRFNYFAYEFPQTYYGKMTNKDPKMTWNTRGWRYVRNWSHDLWTGYFLPLWFFGLLGTRGWRGATAAFMLALTGFWLLYPTNDALNTIPWWPPDLPAPSWWIDSRSYLLVFDAILLPILAFGGRRGWQTRILCWGLANTVLFFSVYTLGDWMKAWRWMSLLQVPAAVLFALGAGALADVADRGIAALPAKHLDKVFWALIQVAVVAVCLLFGNEFTFGTLPLLGIAEAGMALALVGGLLSERQADSRTLAGWTVMALILAAAVLPNITHTKAVLPRPETGPFSIKKRVEFVQALKQTLELDGRLVDLDVDQGAHLWWGRDDFAMMDIAGLVDIPMAQHRFRRPFISEYIFKERRPHFAHVHGGWASNSRIPTHPEWRRDYFEIPGYPAGKTQLHIGNHIRRDLVMKREYTHPADRKVEFEGGVILEGFALPSEPARSRMMWIEIAVRDLESRSEGEDIRLLLAASKDGVLAQSWSIPLGYGWFSAPDWRSDEVNIGKYKLPIPASMEEGIYDIGFVFMGPDGEVLQPIGGADPIEPRALPDGAWMGGTELHPAVFATGEVVFPGKLTVVSVDELAALARADRDEAIEHAKRGRCMKAEQSWFLARKHRPIDKRWADEHGPNVRLNIATCWAWLAEQQPENAIVHLERARILDHNAPGYLRNKDPVADALYAEGKAAYDAGRWEEAYRKFSDTLRVDATRSWARRYAEKARSFRLGIDPESLAAEDAKREEQRRKSMERRKNSKPAEAENEALLRKREAAKNKALRERKAKQQGAPPKTQP